VYFTKITKFVNIKVFPAACLSGDSYKSFRVCV